MKLKVTLLFILFVFKSFCQEKDLNFFLKKARENAPLLVELSNQIKANTIDSLLNKAVHKSQISANLYSNYVPNINEFGYDTALINGQTVSGLLNFNQKILGHNQVKTQSETFKLLHDALSLNKKIATKDLDKAIILQYIIAYSSAAQMVYNQKMVVLLKNEATILKKLTQNAIYKQTDYLTFLATLKQQELQTVVFKQQYANDLALLNYISGEVDTTVVILKKPEIALKNSLDKNKTWFIKQFKIDSLKVLNQDKLIDNLYKPSISLLGDAGYLSSFTYQRHKNFGFSLGFGLSIPIYDGNQRQLLHQKNNIALATNFAYKNNFNKQYQQQKLMLFQKLNQAAVIENQLQSQLQIAEALIEANKKLLVTGDAQITDFVIAIGNMITINNQISQNNRNTLQLINEINYWITND
jgi:Outer membrane efflux protein